VLAPRGHQPLLPPVSCSARASSSLTAGGELPRQGSSTWATRSPRGRLPRWICRPSSLPWRWRRWRAALPDRSLSKPLWRWQRWCGTVRRWLTLVSFYFSSYILTKSFM
jgi:hypothetical protein